MSNMSNNLNMHNMSDSMALAGKMQKMTRNMQNITRNMTENMLNL